MNTPLYIISDVHGCYETLMALIAKLPPKATLVFTGDLIDRGPDSTKVLEFVKEGGHACVMGNHEKMFLEAMDITQSLIDQTIATKLWLQNGGDTTQESIDSAFSQEKLETYVTWIASLPSFLEYNIPDENGKTLFVTHGFGLPYWNRRHTSSYHSRFRHNRFKKRIDTPKVREHYDYDKDYMDHPVFNVFGHDIQEEGKVLLTDSYAAIDTGCVYGMLHRGLPILKHASLSALEWPSKRIIQQRYIG
ncbi:MAG: serine/threonine protein phosphatase [Campylobacteraceae bacterium]|nr:serine/threonine protein phosphatase [Campylobacteraceae bacterium]